MNYGCKPSVEQVFQAYLSIQNNPENAITTTEPIQKQVNDDGILIKIASGSLGDTIGAMTVISSFQKNKGGSGSRDLQPGGKVLQKFLS